MQVGKRTLRLRIVQIIAGIVFFALMAGIWACLWVSPS
jgi:hypothetical protein